MTLITSAPGMILTAGRQSDSLSVSKPFLNSNLEETGQLHGKSSQSGVQTWVCGSATVCLCDPD